MNYEKNKIKIIFFSIILSALFAWAESSRAATYYVDQTGGNDGNAGTSAGAAWKTAGKVSGTTFAAGDNILFKRGEVWRDAILSVHNSGSAGNVITYGAYGSGANPLINGADVFTSWTSEVVGSFTAYYQTSTIDPRIVMQNTTRLPLVASKAALTPGTYWWDDPNNRVYIRTTGDDAPSGYTMQVAQRSTDGDGLIKFNGKSYITIDGVDAIYSRDACIHNYPNVAGQTTLVAKNLTTSYSAKGQITFGSDTQWVHNITVDNVTVSEANILNPGGNEAVTMAYVDGCEVKNSTVHDFYQEGIDMKAFTKNCKVHNNHVYNQKPDAWSSLPAIYCDGCSHVEIYNNKVHALPHAWAMGIFINDEAANRTLDNITVHNNLIYDAGMGIHLACGNSSTVSNINIYNNVFAGIRNETIALNEHLLGRYSGTNNIKNNIFWTNTVDIIDGTTGNQATSLITISHNLFKAGYSSETIGTNSVVTSTSPFTNYGTWDLTLASGSPAINAGVNVGLTTDYLGNAIVGLPDIGAYEYASGDTTAPASPTGLSVN